MNLEEHAAKPLLAAAGIATPVGRLATSPEEAERIATELGEVVVKAQVPAGKRGLAGGIRRADDPAAARAETEAMLALEIGGHPVERLLVEQCTPFTVEVYAAVLTDPAAKSPQVIFSPAGGMDVEEIAASQPERLRRRNVDVRGTFEPPDAAEMVAGLGLGHAEAAVADALVKLYRVYRAHDAELVEINPLAVREDGAVIALDCKLVVDDSGLVRQALLAERGTPDRLTALEHRGQALGLKYIELDGDIGLLANGAGLTMATMDVIAQHGGRPANFLEIGGEAYTKATPAIELVLDNPRVKTLVVNFCGAFARTDVMVDGVTAAWAALAPDLPVFFSIHGTGASDAIAILKDRLGLDPYPTMDEAIVAAVAAARGDAEGRR